MESLYPEALKGNKNSFRNKVQHCQSKYVFHIDYYWLLNEALKHNKSNSFHFKVEGPFILGDIIGINSSLQVDGSMTGRGLRCARRFCPCKLSATFVLEGIEQFFFPPFFCHECSMCSQKKKQENIGSS